MSGRRILHVLSGLDYGGVETWLLQLVRRMRSHTIDVLLFSDSAGVYEPAIRGYGSTVLRVSPPSSAHRFLRGFRDVVREYGPYDGVHSHVWLASGLVVFAAAQCGIPFRLVHSRTSADPHNGGPVRRVYAQAMRALIKNYATHIAAVSDLAGRRLYSDRQWNSKGILIPTAIDCDRYDGVVNAMMLRRSLGLSDDAFVIGHVGSFRPAKNHMFMLAVFKEVLHIKPNAYLLLVGDGPSRAAVREHAKVLKIHRNVLFTGVRDDVPEIMRGAMDVFLFPSTQEGMGRVVVEAQAAGLPCVVSAAVPPEADVVPGLITRLSLGESARCWADAVALSTDRRTISPSDALAAVRRSRMSMDSLVPLLEELYDR